MSGDLLPSSVQANAAQSDPPGDHPLGGRLCPGGSTLSVLGRVARAQYPLCVPARHRTWFRCVPRCYLPACGRASCASLSGTHRAISRCETPAALGVRRRSPVAALCHPWAPQHRGHAPIMGGWSQRASLGPGACKHRGTRPSWAHVIGGWSAGMDGDQSRAARDPQQPGLTGRGEGWARAARNWRPTPSNRFSPSGI